MPQGGLEGPFLYMLAMLPLISWIAEEYPELARAPHTSSAQAYVDDAVPMARDGKAPAGGAGPDAEVCEG